MLAFMLLALVTLTNAAPQNYRRARQPHLEYGPTPATTFSMSNFLTDLQTVMDIQTQNYEPQNLLSNSVEEYHTVANSLPSAPLAFTRQQDFAIQSSNLAAPTPIVSKRFYLHTAPEDDEEIVQQQHITVGKPRKNYNVVFIKTPAKSTHRTALKIVPAINEERTVIYVLAKKHDATEIDAQVHEPVTTTAKPEVFFIKYKTNEEAEHAQQSIQAQYDALGGSTQVSNEGVAPVSSAIGALAAQQQTVSASNEAYDFNDEGVAQSFNEAQLQSFPTQQSAEVPFLTENNGYLPPERRF